MLAEWGPARVTAEGLGFALDMGPRTAAVRPGAPALFLQRPGARPGGGAGRTPACRRSSATCWHPRSPWRQPSPGGWPGSGRPRNRGDSWSGGGPLTRLAAARLQMVPLVLALVQDAGNRAQALDSRGFNGAAARTSYRDVPDTAAQRAFRAVALLLAVAAVALRISGQWPDMQWPACSGPGECPDEAAIAPGADYGLQLPRGGRVRPAGSGG